MKNLQRLHAFSAAVIVGICALAGPALAAGKSTPTTSTGGGGGTAGGTKSAPGGTNVQPKPGGKTSSTAFDNWGIFYNGGMAQGEVVYSYTPDGSVKSLSVSVANVYVPDGTVVALEDEEVWVNANGTNSVSVIYLPITIEHNQGTLTMSGANVPFLIPSAGETDLYLWADPQHLLMGAIIGKLG